MPLSPGERSKILASIKALVLKHHINVASVDYEVWMRTVDERTPPLLGVDQEEFEDGVRDLLSGLGTSHTAFFHESQTQLLPQHTIGATLRAVACGSADHWMFLDVFDGGLAHNAGIRPGHRLLAVDGVACAPPSMPRFGIGQAHRLSIAEAAGQNEREFGIAVPHRKGSKRRPPIIEPRSLVYSIIEPDIGLLKVTYFSGTFGIGFANTLDAAMQALQDGGCQRLILDLRGNIGGSLGFARLASYLCPGRLPIGHSLTPSRLRNGYAVADLPRVPMPGTRIGLALTLARFAARDKSVVLLTQSLGPQPVHRKIVVLVNEWTNSAAEIIASFAAENRLAPIVGVKTAGNILGATNFKLASGHWLRLPIFGWYTSQGQCLDGIGVAPDISVEMETGALANGEDNQLAAAIGAVRSM
jgi:C-terminal processing protease CtpA/Prc